MIDIPFRFPIPSVKYTKHLGSGRILSPQQFLYVLELLILPLVIVEEDWFDLLGIIFVTFLSIARVGFGPLALFDMREYFLVSAFLDGMGSGVYYNWVSVFGSD